MKKIISTCCILIIFVLFLFGCNSAHKAKLEEGVYQAENFLIEGKNADMLRITVKRDDTFDKFSHQNIFIIDWESYTLEILFVLKGEEKHGVVCYASYAENLRSAKIYSVFKMQDELLYIDGTIIKDGENTCIDAEVHIGQYTPIYDKVKIYFISDK